MFVVNSNYKYYDDYDDIDFYSVFQLSVAGNLRSRNGSYNSLRYVVSDL
jgi:hypothetical protein